MAAIPIKKAPGFIVEEYMERWARWSERGARFAASLPCPTGRIMRGMSKTKCPTCLGRRRTENSQFTGVEGNKVGSDLPWVSPCPACNGHGKVQGLDAIRRTKTIRCEFCVDPDTHKPTGTILGRTCFKCHGRKKRQIVSERANPASIHSTWTVGLNEDEDEISMLIDRTVAGWGLNDKTVWLGIIVQLEYRVHATQTEKSKHARISQSYYSKNLAKAHQLVEAALFQHLNQE